MTIAARLRRLEERFAPPQPAITIEQWCDPEGRACDPTTQVVEAVEQQAGGRWRVAAWAPDHGCALLLAEDNELRIVEL